MLRERSIATHALAAIAVAAGALLSPRAVSDGLILVWSIGCSLSVLNSARRMRGTARRVYGLFGATGLVLIAGIVVRGIHGEAIGVEQPLPSPADFFHVPAYLMYFSATWLIYRNRSTTSNLDAWLDSLASTLAIGLILWGLFLGDFTLAAEDTALEIALHVGYNLVVFIVLGLMLQIGATPGRRSPAYHLLGAASASFVVADLYATFANATDSPPYLTIALSPVAYGLCAAASRHHTGPEVVEPQDRGEIRSERGRALFVGGVLITPALVAIVAVGASWATRAVSTAGSLLLAVVVATRVYRLLRSQREAGERERMLSSELSVLATLAAREDIVRHLPSAANRLAPRGHSVELSNDNHEIGASITSDFPLPVGLAEGSQCLRVTPALFTDLDKRILRTLVRDAGYLANSLEATAEIERRRSEEEANRRIAVNERRFRALVQNASDIVMVVGPGGEVSYASEAVSNVLGYRPEAFLDRTLEWIVHENDWEWAREYFGSVITGTNSDRDREMRAIHADGSVRLFECVLTDMRAVEGIEGIVMNATDVTAKRTLERDLRDAETTDLLTLQLNRTAFLAETDTAIRRSSVSNSSVAVAIINVDDFRSVNEGLGPALADQVLVEIAQAVKRSVRLNDVVARLNGDEFGILMAEGYSAEEAVHAIERVIDEIAEPIQIGGHTLTLRATAGVVLDTDGSGTGVSLLRYADTALDVAKQDHRGQTVLFEDAMGEAASQRIELRNTLETAIRDDDLRLAYQPVVSIETGEIVSMEALARWEHPTRGNISPGVFIPIAESAGLITALGEWALRSACEQVVRWSSAGLDGFAVSVNMSGHQLREENIISRVRTILAETGVDPTRMTIEITESVLIDDTDFIAQRISALRELGLKLAIDDFGTGYSSLSYLTRYEFDVLKIDRSFVIPLADPSRTREREIVKSMIDLARALGAVTIAEGIEEAAEFETLAALGCDFAQGYLFWYPLELEDVARAHAESRQLAA